MIPKTYHKEKGGTDTIHGTELTWPGTDDGFPVINAPRRLVRRGEFRDTPLIENFNYGTFCLWLPEDSELFVAIRRYVSHRLFQLLYIERHFIAEHRDWCVYMEWNQIYGDGSHVSENNDPYPS